MKENNEVTNAKKDTKKLNASVAIISLQYLDGIGELSKKQVSYITALCDRLTYTKMYKEDSVDENLKIYQHAIKLIEEYLEEEGV